MSDHDHHHHHGGQATLHLQHTTIGCDYSADQDASNFAPVLHFPPQRERKRRRRRIRSATSTTEAARQLQNGASYVVKVKVHIFENQALNDRMTPADRDTAGLIKTLNYGFRDSAFSFEQLGAADVYVDETIFNLCPNPTMAQTETIVNEYSVGDKDVLNVYLCNYGAAGVMQRHASRESGAVWMGNWYQYVPGAEEEFQFLGIAYEKHLRIGFVLIHEVGHWLSLAHTWGENGEGCDGPNDGIDDTPAHDGMTLSLGAEAGLFDCFRPEATYGKIDTCPNQPGLDPIDNYMNYLASNCLEIYGEFTDGQREQMLEKWETDIYVPVLDDSETAGSAWRIRSPASGLSESPFAGGFPQWYVSRILFFSDTDCTNLVAAGSATAISSTDESRDTATFPESWGVNENAFDGSSDSFWIWTSFFEEDLWIGLDFAPSDDITVKCVIWEQDQDFFTDHLFLDVRPPGRSYWNPVAEFKDMKPGENQIVVPGSDDATTVPPTSHPSAAETAAPVAATTTPTAPAPAPTQHSSAAPVAATTTPTAIHTTLHPSTAIPVPVTNAPSPHGTTGQPIAITAAPTLTSTSPPTPQAVTTTLPSSSIATTVPSTLLPTATVAPMPSLPPSRLPSSDPSTQPSGGGGATVHPTTPFPSSVIAPPTRRPTPFPSVNIAPPTRRPTLPFEGGEAPGIQDEVTSNAAGWFSFGYESFWQLMVGTNLVLLGFV